MLTERFFVGSSNSEGEINQEKERVFSFPLPFVLCLLVSGGWAIASSDSVSGILKSSKTFYVIVFIYKC